MKFAAVSAFALIAGVSAAPRAHELASSNYQFSHYAKEFKKSYSPAETVKRQAIYEANMKSILAHNAKPNVSYKMGINEFTDMEVSKCLVGGVGVDLRNSAIFLAGGQLILTFVCAVQENTF